MPASMFSDRVFRKWMELDEVLRAENKWSVAGIVGFSKASDVALFFSPLLEEHEIKELRQAIQQPAQPWPGPEMERAEMLTMLMQSVGFAVWQLQELENSTATYLVVRVVATPGIGLQKGQELMQRTESRTLGSLAKELGKTGIIEDQLAEDLQTITEERNWLIHRARRETRGILANGEQLRQMLQKLEALADRALQLHKSLGADLERYVLKCGVDRAVIDAEAARLAQSWGLMG